jgi:hypothetical protein
MLETSLHQKVAEPIDHKRISLGDNRLDNLVLLVWSPNFELLLEEDRSLLVITTNDLVDDIFPVAIDIAIKKSPVV